MQDGWIKLWRKLMESEVWKDPFLLKLFLWCLLTARRQPSRNPNGPQTGEFDTSRSLGAEALGYSQSSFHHRLQRLERIGCITLKVGSKLTRVSICNYSSYQLSEDDTWQQVGSDLAAFEQATLLDEERKKERKAHQPKFDPLTMTLPESLRTAAFTRAWSEWIAMRRRRRFSVSEAYLVRQLGFLGGLSESSAVFSLEYITRNEHQGVFEVGRNGGPGKGQPAGDLFGSLRRFAERSEPDDEN